jgi:hypothetical protein
MQCRAPAAKCNHLEYQMHVVQNNMMNLANTINGLAADANAKQRIMQDMDNRLE